jgi:hypothetical protein
MSRGSTVSFIRPRGRSSGVTRWWLPKEKGLNWNFVTMEVHGVTDTAFGRARFGAALCQGHS